MLKNLVLVLCLLWRAVGSAQPFDANLIAALSAGPDPVRAGEVVQYAVTVTDCYAGFPAPVRMSAGAGDHTAVAQGARIHRASSQPRRRWPDPRKQPERKDRA
jgi:hypothetical protein